MKRRHTALLMALSAVVGFCSRAAAAEAVELNLEQICARITESASLLTDGIAELVRLSADSAADDGVSVLNGDCAASLECLLAARPDPVPAAAAGEVVVSEGVKTTAETICGKLQPILDLSPSEVRELESQALGLGPDVEDPTGIEACRRFLHCTLGGETDSRTSDANAALSWRTEFERICSQTRSGAALDTEELRQLVEDSDRLLETLQGLQTSEAKVASYRLNMCRDFFEYLLEFDALEEEPGEEPPS
jgi:hypothetical protein